ncbi:MAG: dihydrodipicolinate synthase family protein [Nocardiopsaceae bacterium]|nr:dihydrodipicolinate synthase family protein [Nocardiopsaceae bacterium]
MTEGQESDYRRGLVAALVTPVAADGSVCEQSVAKLINEVRPHVRALLPTLSTGEGQWLSPPQWSDMVSATVRHARRTPVIAGVLAPGTEAAQASIAEAARLGATAAAATTPFGTEISQCDMVRHYERLAEGELPVVVYHESAVSGNAMTLETLLRVCRIPGITAVKDSAGDPGFTVNLIAAADVPVLQGLEHLLGRCGRVAGQVAALSNVEPELCATALACPESRIVTARFLEACRRYRLDRDDFVVALKTELHRRGVLTTAATVVDLPEHGEAQLC